MTAPDVHMAEPAGCEAQPSAPSVPEESIVLPEPSAKEPEAAKPEATNEAPTAPATSLGGAAHAPAQRGESLPAEGAAPSQERPLYVSVIEKPSALRTLSQASQLVLVALAVFGYFYTVRPVYQREQLAEQIAKQTFELERLAEANVATMSELQVTRSELGDLSEKEALLRASLDERGRSLDSARVETDAARAQLVKLRAAQAEAAEETTRIMNDVIRLERSRADAEESLATSRDALQTFVGAQLELLGLFEAHEIYRFWLTQFDAAVDDTKEEDVSVLTLSPSDFQGRRTVPIREIDAFLHSEGFPSLGSVTSISAERDVQAPWTMQDEEEMTLPISVRWFSPRPTQVATNVMESITQVARTLQGEGSFPATIAAVYAGTDHGTAYLEFLKEIDRRVTAAVLDSLAFRAAADEFATLAEEFRRRERGIWSVRNAADRRRADLLLRIEFGAAIRRFKDTHWIRLLEAVSRQDLREIGVDGAERHLLPALLAAPTDEAANEAPESPIEVESNSWRLDCASYPSIGGFRFLNYHSSLENKQQAMCSAHAEDDSVVRVTCDGFDLRITGTSDDLSVGQPPVPCTLRRTGLGEAVDASGHQ